MKNLLAPHVILDLTDKSGAFCAKMLGDLGADVIKIEKIGIATEDHIDRMAFNTGKRSITLDIESVEGKAIFLDLVRRADFVIESFPPGYLQKLGLGYSDLSEVNPAVIMTSITPFGQTGPHKDLKATDLICNAMGGLVFIIGDEDRPPVLVGSDQAYFHGGAQAAVGSMIAHHWRRKSGLGQHVDVSIQEAVMWTLCYPVIYAYADGTVFRRAGNYQLRAGGMRYRRVYPCKDGFVCCMLGFGLMVGTMQARLVKLMDEEGLAGDMASTDWRTLSLDDIPQARIDQWETAMMQYFVRHTKAELQRLSLEHRLHVVPVRDIREVAEYEQLRYRNYWSQMKVPELDREAPFPGQYFASNEVSGRVSLPPPQPGEHNHDIYHKELGYSEGQISELQRKGIIQ